MSVDSHTNNIEGDLAIQKHKGCPHAISGTV
jgi:hypothetical protein